MPAALRQMRHTTAGVAGSHARLHRKLGGSAAVRRSVSYSTHSAQAQKAPQHAEAARATAILLGNTAGKGAAPPGEGSCIPSRPAPARMQATALPSRPRPMAAALRVVRNSAV